MRELHVEVDDDHIDEITSILDEYDADFTTVSQNGSTLVLCPLPTVAISSILDKIRESALSSLAPSRQAFGC